MGRRRRLVDANGDLRRGDLLRTVSDLRALREDRPKRKNGVGNGRSARAERDVQEARSGCYAVPRVGDRPTRGPSASNLAARWNAAVEVGAPVELRIDTSRKVLIYHTRTTGRAILDLNGEAVVRVRGLISPCRLSQLHLMR